MSNHPLKPYYILLEGQNLLNHINSFNNHENFITARMIENHHDSYEWNEEKSCYIVINDVFDTPYELTLEKYLLNKINNLTSQLKQTARDFIWSSDKKLVDEYCRKLILELDALRNNCQTINVKEVKIIIEALDDAISFLKENSYDNINSVKEKKKLIWKGKINTLVTLFFDLSQNTNNLKAEFIDYDRQGLTDFIVDSFLDNEGKEIESSTVYRILDANPYDLKKAKKRIEVSE